MKIYHGVVMILLLLFGYWLGIKYPSTGSMFLGKVGM